MPAIANICDTKHKTHFQLPVENLIRGLDDDEVDFLHVVDKAKANAEHKQHLEESKELREFREQRQEMEEKSMDNVSEKMLCMS